MNHSCKLLKAVTLCLLVGYLGLFGKCFAQTPSEHGSTSPSQDLKNFLTTQPPIDQFVFKKRDLYQPDYPDLPKVDTNAYKHYAARWQGPDFLLRLLESEEEIDKLGETTNSVSKAFGKSGSIFWKLFGDDYVYWEDTKQNYSLEYSAVHTLPRDQPLLLEVSAMRNLLLQALNVGIGQMRPGTLKWSGDSFVAESQSGDTLEGKLILSNGLPGEIQYQVKGESGMSSVLLSYGDYETVGSLPKKFIYGYVRTNGLRIPIAEFEILGLNISPSTISPAKFSKDSLIISGLTKTIRQDGKSLYWTNVTGRLKTGHEWALQNQPL